MHLFISEPSHSYPKVRPFVSLFLVDAFHPSLFSMQCSCLGPVIMSLISEKMIHQARPPIDLQGANFTSNNHNIMAAYDSWIKLRIWEIDMLPSSTCIALGKRKRPCLKSKEVLLGFSGTTPIPEACKSTKNSAREQIDCWECTSGGQGSWRLKQKNPSKNETRNME